MLQALADWLGPDGTTALLLSLKVSLWATMASLPPGILCALVLARVLDADRPAPGGAVSDGLDGLRALCVAHWSSHPDEGATARVVAGDAPAEEELDRWGAEWS